MQMSEISCDEDRNSLLLHECVSWPASAHLREGEGGGGGGVREAGTVMLLNVVWRPWSALVWMVSVLCLFCLRRVCALHFCGMQGSGLQRARVRLCWQSAGECRDTWGWSGVSVELFGWQKAAV